MRNQCSYSEVLLRGRLSPLIYVYHTPLGYRQKKKMSHLDKDKQKLVGRIKRIRGQVDFIERSWSAVPSDAKLLQSVKSFASSIPAFPFWQLASISLDYMVALLDAGAGDYTILPLAERLLAARLPSAIRRFRTPGTWCSRTFRGWINRARCSQRSCREIGSPGSVVSYGISRARSVNASTWYSDLAFCTRSKRFHPVVRGPASATAPGWAIRQSRTE